MSALIHVPKLPNPDRLKAIAEMMHKGKLTPKGVTKPEEIAVRILAGMEVGLKPVQAVNWIMVVNGRAVIWGDAALALVRASGLLVDFEERIEGEGDERAAICKTVRAAPRVVGTILPDQVRETRFSVADAKAAGLWGKAGPWTDYTERQMMWRARSWNLRDGFGDVLAGLGIAEEEQDVPVRQVHIEPTPTHPDTAPATAPTPTEGQAVIGDDVLTALSQARPGWVRSQGIDPHDDAAVKAVWLKALDPYGVTSAKQLTPEQGAKFLVEIATVGHQQEVKEVFEGAASAS